MIPEVRACSIPSAPNSPIGHIERTPGHWESSRVTFDEFIKPADDGELQD
jgi:hypothetical protein